jgi:hypothetical protein
MAKACHRPAGIRSRNAGCSGQKGRYQFKDETATVVAGEPKACSKACHPIRTDMARIRTHMDSDPRFCLKNRVYELGNEDLNLD